MATGTVKFYNNTKNFGFITPDEGEKDIFVHNTGLIDQIWEGDKVEFEIIEEDRGPKAINVKKVTQEG